MKRKPSITARLFVAAIPSGILHFVVAIGVLWLGASIWKSQGLSLNDVLVSLIAGAQGYWTGLAASAFRRPWRSAIIGGILSGILYLPLAAGAYVCIGMMHGSTESDFLPIYFGAIGIVTAGVVGGAVGGAYFDGFKRLPQNDGPAETAIQIRKD